MEYLKPMQVFKLPDQVALQVERPYVAAQMPENLYLLNVLVVQANLMKGIQHPIIVFCPLHPRPDFRSALVGSRALNASYNLCGCSPCAEGPP